MGAWCDCRDRTLVIVDSDVLRGLAPAIRWSVFAIVLFPLTANERAEHLQGSPQESLLGREDVAVKLRQKWQATAGTKFTKPRDHYSVSAGGTFICLYFLPRPSFHPIERGGRLQTGFSCPKAFHWMRPRAIWGVAATFSGVFHMKQCQKPLLRNIA